MLKSIVSVLIVLMGYYSFAQSARVRSNGVITDVVIQYYSLEKLGTDKKEFDMKAIDSIKFNIRDEQYSMLYKTLDKVNVPYTFTIKPKERLSDYDSLKQKVLQIDYAVNNIQDNMLLSHKEFSTGVHISIIGAVLSIIGIVSNKGTSSDVLLYAGSIASVCGTVLIIDSHKYFGRGGRNERH